MSFPFICIVLLVLFQETLCKCTEKHSVIKCDHMNDLYTTKLDTTLRDVIIESNETISEDSMVCLNRGLFFSNLAYAHSIKIIGQLNGLCFDTLTRAATIESLYLLENNLKEIQKYFFHLKLHVLCLVNNNIKSIEKQAFSGSRFDELDLSHNKLEYLDDIGLIDTKYVIIRNNKLEHIETGVFPTSLKVLDLSYNQLNGNLDDVFVNLHNLQKLSLKDNKLYIAPNVSEMENLKLLDLSHNKITVVPKDVFKNSSSLEILNLSHNKIVNLDFLLSIVAANDDLHARKIRLHFNQLNYVNVSNLAYAASGMCLSLFGNPWNCKAWTSFQKFMKKKYWKQQYCDYEYFSQGHLPYCISNDHFKIKKHFFRTAKWISPHVP